MAGPQQSDRERWEALVSQIEQARYEYYQQDTPRLSDAEYDELFVELRDLEQRFPELQRADSRRRRSVVPGRTCSSPSSTCSG